MTAFRSINPVFFHDFNKADKALTMRMALTNKRNFIRGISWVSIIYFFIIGIALFMVTNLESTDPLIVEEEKDSMNVYIGVIAGLLILYFFIIFSAYTINVKPLLKDLKGNVKAIELVSIREKKYMPQNNSYHLYVRSLNRASIEVTEKEFRQYELGDEINLEFTPHANIYLGYY